MIKEPFALNKKIGLFDIDSRELDKEGLGLGFRERVRPIAGKLNKLYDFAYKNQLVFVFTTCCSGRFLKKDSLDYVRYIPIDQDDRSWMKDLENFRYFYLQKRQHGSPRKNSEHCDYNFFKYNENAIKLFKKLNIKEWVVFGNGFDYCVNLACLHILKEKFKLTVLEDAVVPAFGPGKIGTEKNKKDILKEFKTKGAEILTTESFLKKYDKK